MYNYMKFANQMPNGCQDQIGYCKQTNRTSLADYAICSEATNMCRDNVGMFFNCPGVHIEKVNYLLTVKLEGPYYAFGNRGVYDIRHPSKVSGGRARSMDGDGLGISHLRSMKALTKVMIHCTGSYPGIVLRRLPQERLGHERHRSEHQLHPVKQ